MLAKFGDMTGDALVKTSRALNKMSCAANCGGDAFSMFDDEVGFPATPWALCNATGQDLLRIC
jgi:hypothetical protein